MSNEQEQNTLEVGERIYLKQTQQFWTLQVTGWLGYAFLVFFAIVHPQFDKADFSLSSQVINLTIETLSGFLLSYLQWVFIRKIIHLPVQKTLFLSFSAAALLGLIYNFIKLSSYKMVVYQQHWYEEWSMLEFGGWLMFSLSTMFVWTSIFFIMHYNARLQKEHELFLRANTLVKDSQLKMLRYQLNPHFMFNTMNAISTLILKQENDKANEMLDKLCEFFRYTLDDHAKAQTTLDKEIELLELYLSIEKVRFGDRLNVKLHICESVTRCLVPSMLLQPLIENAIKYAIEPQKEVGFIAINATQKEGRLMLEITDSGHNNSEKVSNGFGIGIKNTKARLSVMFNGDYNININESFNQGTRVTISIPCHQLSSS